MADRPMALPNYPYRNRFSREQLLEAMNRKDRLVELLTDPVGPDGTLINIPADMLHILAFHLAFAGADAHDDHRKLIESRSCVDDSGMFEMYEWAPRGDFGDQPAVADPGGEAAAVATQMKTQLTPEVRAAVLAILADEYAAATKAAEITDRERAENVLIEHRELRDNLEAP